MNVEFSHHEESNYIKKIFHGLCEIRAEKELAHPS